MERTDRLYLIEGTAAGPSLNIAVCKQAASIFDQWAIYAAADADSDELYYSDSGTVK